MDREGQERVSFYLSTDVKRAFQVLCVKKKVTMSDALREAVVKAIREAEDK